MCIYITYFLIIVLTLVKKASLLSFLSVWPSTSDRNAIIDRYEGPAQTSEAAVAVVVVVVVVVEEEDEEDSPLTRCTLETL